MTNVVGADLAAENGVGSAHLVICVGVAGVELVRRWAVLEGDCGVGCDGFGGVVEAFGAAASVKLGELMPCNPGAIWRLNVG